MWHLIVDQALPTTRFYHISGVGEIRGHSTLLSALVEMWRLKTHSFVLPTGKVTVTLEDVLHILGLLIDGEIVTDKPTTYAQTKDLPLLQSFEQIGTYSWGFAILVHLYRSLCHASLYDCKEMDGSLDLLFVWAWE
ncbi:hypothetical protein Ahy_A07g033329 [Arachis hypogaea]|uniref:Aminotransferase-like plant mobile domain-containing protein n=1 Tax=Arachis hypogaea TaxID=3818 RepID=A0A445C8Y4_ARAHY|nr:hypothetical protein Ahy_A07g033329 [Arachis hypogaea]